MNNFLKQFFALFDKLNIDIYLTGGSARDFILNKDFEDLDFATPYSTKKLIDLLEIKHYDTFAIKFGTLKTNILGRNVEITTFRKEGEYKDHRRPTNIEFVTDIKEDAKRRDFTINALYINKNFDVIDFYNGLDDLNNKVIKMIGDPYIRLKEDPVRIIRAIRFASNMNFSIDNNLKKALIDLKDNIKFISESRLNMELKKFNNIKDYYNFIK